MPRPVRRGRPARVKLAIAAPTQDAEVDATSRAELRPALREDDPRARAAKRAAELKGHGVGADDGEDRFYIDSKDIPDGWDYEWKRVKTHGASDPAYEVATARAGWEPVPVDRHPSYMPKGWRGDIERDGMILMERPKVISDEARARDQKAARDLIRTKEDQLRGTPQGQFERANKDQSLVNVKHSYEYVPIPD